MSRVVVWALIASAIALVCASFVLRTKSSGGHTPMVPVPDGLDALDPQVRDHLRKHIQAVRDEPADARRQAMLGLVYEANEFWTEARGSFEATLRLAPNDPLARYHLAIAVEAQGDLAGAIELYRGLAAEHPDFAPAFHRLGTALIETDALEDAAAAFGRVLELAPNAAAGYSGMGEVMLRRREYERAAEFLEKSVHLSPAARVTHYCLGMAYRGLGRKEDAQRELSIGVDAEQREYLLDEWSALLGGHRKSVPAQISYAKGLLSTGQIDDGRQVLEEALSWHPDNVEILNNLAIAYTLKPSKLTEARDLLLRALELDEGRFLTHSNLAACFTELTEYDKALEHADRAVTLAPDQGPARLARGNVLLRLQRLAEAAAEFEEATRLSPHNPQYRIHFADCCVALQRLPVARAHLEEAVRLAPVMLEAWLRLGDVCLMLADTDGAQDALDAALRLAPNDARVRALGQEIGGP